MRIGFGAILRAKSLVGYEQRRFYSRVADSAVNLNQKDNGAIQWGQLGAAWEDKRDWGFVLFKGGALDGCMADFVQGSWSLL